MQIHRTARLLVVPLVLASLALSVAAQDDAPSMDRARSLIRSRRWSQAEEALAAITRADPSEGEAWFELMNARHQLKDWAGAAQAGRHAVEFGAYRSTALYNLACALSLGGELDQARDALVASTEAGYLDFDWMEQDADLAPLAGRYGLPLPSAGEHLELKGRNGVRMNYAVNVPADFDPEQSYPVLVALAPGGVRSLDWMVAELWTSGTREAGWIVVSIAAPERGWSTHPTHHALEDLLKALQKEYKVEGGAFHLFGIASGCAPASMYAGMSKKYFQTMSVVSSSAWTNYDDSDLTRWRNMPVLQIVGSNSHTLELDETTHARLLQSGVRATLRVVEGDGVLVASLRGKALVEAIAGVQRPR